MEDEVRRRIKKELAMVMRDKEVNTRRGYVYVYILVFILVFILVHNYIIWFVLMCHVGGREFPGLCHRRI